MELHGDGELNRVKRAERQLTRTRAQLGKLDLLIPEELGYVPASKAGTELLFDVISTACERTRLIVTTNLAFEQWTEVLDNERLRGAALDRLTHRCHIIDTGGENDRLRDARRRRSGSIGQRPASSATLPSGQTNTGTAHPGA